MATLQTFHTGRPLNLWERCCLTSFIDRGHTVVLYSYEPLALPPGVRSAPAEDVIGGRERDEFFRAAPVRFTQSRTCFAMRFCAGRAAGGSTPILFVSAVGCRTMTS
jgi:hypothetical protein